MKTDNELILIGLKSYLRETENKIYRLVEQVYNGDMDALTLYRSIAPLAEECQKINNKIYLLDPKHDEIPF